MNITTHRRQEKREEFLHAKIIIRKGIANESNRRPWDESMNTQNVIIFGSEHTVVRCNDTQFPFIIILSYLQNGSLGDKKKDFFNSMVCLIVTIHASSFLLLVVQYFSLRSLCDSLLLIVCVLLSYSTIRARFLVRGNSSPSSLTLQLLLSSCSMFVIDNG
jgi:hypothetical protein